MPVGEVSIQLSQQEALVLFEWLAKTDDDRSLPIEHPAEQTVLWKLEGQLEKQVPVFADNYAQLLLDARHEIGMNS